MPHPIQLIERELGERGIEELNSLMNHYVDPADLNAARDAIFFTAARMAPSIITRSELELFGRSMPRFALRIYFDNGMFVNCRRLMSIRNQFSLTPQKLSRLALNTYRDVHGLMGDEPPLCQDELNSDSFGKDIQQIPIADGLLLPPGRFSRAGFHFIEVPLFREYGEEVRCDDEDSAARLGSPYTKTYDLGGGLCAQACCFMAGAMLYEFVKEVHGLGDITTIAARLADHGHLRRPLVIGGLTEEQIITYFSEPRRVGLAATGQFISPNRLRGSICDEDRAYHLREYEDCVAGYVGSGMPVILLVQQSLLISSVDDRPSVYQRNDYGPDCEVDHTASSAHAVVVAGTERWSADRGFRRLMLHDPSALPFMEADVEDLARVGIRYFKAYDGDTDRRLPKCIPVTPVEVKLGLLPTATEQFGLLEVCDGIEPNFPEQRREFILVRLSDLETAKLSERLRPHFTNVTEGALTGNLGAAVKALAAARSLSPDHWVWLECHPNCVKIWDAQRPVAAPLEALFVGRIGAEQLRCARSAHPGNSEEPNPASDADPELTPLDLKPCLVTSFDVGGCQAVLRDWPDGVSLAEVYTLMKDDLPTFFPEMAAANPDWDAVRVFSESVDEPGRAESFAAELTAKYAERNIMIAGFATFVPELVSFPEEESKPGDRLTDARHAQRALEFLIRTAGFISAQHPLPPFTIELVAGSRMRNLWRLDFNNPDEKLAPCFMIGRMDPGEAIDELIERLVTLADAAAAYEGQVVLGVEAEPGTLFRLNNLGSVSAFCRKIDRHENVNLKRFVGLNLDVPHWGFLSDLRLPLLRDPEHKFIRDRIVHAHVSDHGRGHFGDHRIAEFSELPGHDLKGFREWLEFMQQLKHASRDLSCHPPFRGVVSAEKEACKEPVWVQESVNRLRRLIA